MRNPGPSLKGIDAALGRKTLERVQVVKDGSCLFRAVAHQVRGELGMGVGLESSYSPTSESRCTFARVGPACATARRAYLQPEPFPSVCYPVVPPSLLSRTVLWDPGAACLLEKDLC